MANLAGTPLLTWDLIVTYRQDGNYYIYDKIHVDLILHGGLSHGIGNIALLMLAAINLLQLESEIPYC